MFVYNCAKFGAGGRMGGNFGKQKKNIHKVMGYIAYIPNFKVIGRYFEMGGIWGGDFPPTGGMGGENF